MSVYAVVENFKQHASWKHDRVRNCPTRAEAETVAEAWTNHEEVFGEVDSFDTGDSIISIVCSDDYTVEECDRDETGDLYFDVAFAEHSQTGYRTLTLRRSWI